MRSPCINVTSVALILHLTCLRHFGDIISSVYLKANLSMDCFYVFKIYPGSFACEIPRLLLVYKIRVISFVNGVSQMGKCSARLCAIIHV